MPTSPLEVIDRLYPDLGDTDRRIADYVRENPTDTSRFPIDMTASKLHVSKSTLVRFTQKLGYEGYLAFKMELARTVLSHRNPSEGSQESQSASVRIANTYATYLQEMADTLSEEEVDKLAQTIVGADRILVTGINRTFNPARQLQQRLTNVGILSEAVEHLSELHNVFDVFKSTDLLIIFTIADTSKYYPPFVKTFSKNGVPIACVNCTPALAFKRKCDSYITLPRISRDPKVQFLDDQALFFVFIEILIDAVAKQMEG